VSAKKTVQRISGDNYDMNILLRESEVLSLPCFDLVPAEKGDRVAAYWGGRRSDLPERFPKGVTAFKYQKHLLSIDQQLFDELGLQGRGPLALSKWTTTEDDEKLCNVNVSTGRLSDVVFADASPLTAKPAISLPPLEAVLLYGGSAIQEWLAEQRLQRWEYSDVDPKARDFYLKHFNAHLPLFLEEPPFARIGGWHSLWPDDDFYIPREMRLMVWTFRDAEPWYEVFLSPLRNCIIRSRIT
jgi:hypothetical protein